MKHKYRTCDVCGKKIIEWGDKWFRVSKLMSIQGFGISRMVDEVDICDHCWREFVAYVKDKMEK